VHRPKIKYDFLPFVKNSGVAMFRIVEKSEKSKFLRFVQEIVHV